MLSGFTCPAVLALAVLLGLSAGARADEPFYKGKRLTLLINFAAGGPTDIEGRLFAKYLVKHIDGQPGMIVQNMDGAGGLIGAQYLGEIAPKDGTVVGYLSGSAWLYVSDPDRWRVDFRKYEFVAYQPGTTVHYVRTDVPPGMHVPADIAKAQGLIAGGLSADTSKDLRLRLALDMLGVPYKYVTGYRSSPPARLALQRGEISMFSESPPSYRSVVEPSLVKIRGGDAGVLRRGCRPAAAAKAARGPHDPELSAALPRDQRHPAVGPAVRGLPGALRHELDPAAHDRGAARYPAGRAGGAARRHRGARLRQGLRRRGHPDDRVRARLPDRPRHEPDGAMP